MHTSSEYRTYARNALKGKWGTALIVSLIAGLFSGGGSGISVNPFGLSNENTSSVQNTTSLADYERLFEQYKEKIEQLFENPFTAGVLSVIIGVSALIAIAFFVIRCGIELGHKSYYVSLARGEEASIGMLFSKMRIILKALLLNLYTALLIFLWSLLFIIPGIIAAYRYSMSGWIMAQNPDIGVFSAVSESKRIMHGNKWRLFCLQLSFIGWAILCVFTCGLGYFWLNPYVYTSTAAFYLDISGQLSPAQAYEQTYQQF